MILQILNIAGGALLSSEKIAQITGVTALADIAKKLGPMRAKIGVVIFAFGIVGLIERIGIVNFYSLNLGSSYPQALPAIMVGLIMGESILGKVGLLASLINILKPYAAAIGIIAILSGLGSLLFGCVLPLVCTAPFGL